MLGISSKMTTMGILQGNKDENKRQRTIQKNKTDKPTTHDDNKPERNNKKFASFSNVKNLAYRGRVHEIAGVDSLKGLSQAQLNSLLQKLRYETGATRKQKMNKRA